MVYELLIDYVFLSLAQSKLEECGFGCIEVTCGGSNYVCTDDGWKKYYKKVRAVECADVVTEDSVCYYNPYSCSAGGRQLCYYTEIVNCSQPKIEGNICYYNGECDSTTLQCQYDTCLLNYWFDFDFDGTEDTCYYAVDEKCTNNGCKHDTLPCLNDGKHVCNSNGYCLECSSSYECFETTATILKPAPPGEQVETKT